MSSMTLAEISDVREHLWVLSCEREGENKKIIGVLFKGSAKINIWKRESKKKAELTNFIAMVDDCDLLENMADTSSEKLLIYIT